VLVHGSKHVGIIILESTANGGSVVEDIWLLVPSAIALSTSTIATPSLIVITIVPIGIVVVVLVGICVVATTAIGRPSNGR
jgi:hypothetical protein